MRFAYIKNNGYLCIEIFETMQSSVTRSRTSITKSLPASLKCYSKLLYYKKLLQNTKFHAVETSALSCRNKSLDIRKTNESSRITGDGHREESQPDKCKTVVFST